MAFRFDAVGDHLELTNDLMDGWTNMSLSTWLYHTDATHDQDILVANSHGGGEPIVIWRDENGATDTYAWLIVDTGSMLGATAAPTNEWVHYVWTFAGGAPGTVRQYINGVEDGNSPWSPNKATIPSVESPDRYYVSGVIDIKRMEGGMAEYAIWEATLSADDVAMLYAGGAIVHRTPLTIKKANLRVYLPMLDAANDVTVTSVHDASGNNSVIAIAGDPQGMAARISHLGAGPLIVQAPAVVVATFGRRGIRTGGELVGAGIMTGGRM